MQTPEVLIKVDNVVRVGGKEEEIITVVPSTESQVILPSPNKTIGKVNVEAISSDYVKPEGELLITSSGEYNVREYESVKAELTPVLVSIPIDSNRWTSDSSLYPYNQKAVVSVNLGDLTTNSTLRLVNDNESEGIFAKYGFYCSTASDTNITIFAVDKPLADVILKAEITYAEGESGTPIIINPVTIVRKDKLAEICNKTVVEILPSDLEGATQITDYLFSGCSQLENVSLPDSVKTIKQYAFQYCRSLKNSPLNDNITSIETSLFYGCSSLTSVTISTNLKTIPSNAFYGCTALANVKTHDYLTSVGVSAFSYCKNLNELYFSNNCTISSTCFSYSNINRLRFGKSGELSVSQPTQQSSIGYEEINEGVTSISSKFLYQSAERFLILPSTLTSFAGNQTSWGITNLICKAENPPILGEALSATRVFVYTISRYESATNWSASTGKYYPLVNTYEDLANIDTTRYTYACVKGNNLGIADKNNYKIYTYVNGEWKEE